MAKKKLTVQSFSNLIKVQDLRMIVALEKHGTILNAANVMGLSQPAITKRLQDLEKDLGVTLFHRMSRGVEPTPYGEIIIKHAHIILNQLRSAEGEVSDLSSGLGGRLTIGIPVAASTNLISDAIVHLLEKRKNVQINLVEDYNIRLVPALKRSDLDLIIGRLPEESKYDDIDVEKVYKEKLLFVVRNTHPLASKAKITAKDLLTSNWLMPPTDSIMYKKISSFFQSRGLSQPTASVYSLSHVNSLKVLQKQDLIASFPSESIAEQVTSGQVKVLDIDLTKEESEIGIITRKGGFNSPAAEMFMSIIREIAKDYK